MSTSLLAESSAGLASVEGRLGGEVYFVLVVDGDQVGGHVDDLAVDGDVAALDERPGVVVIFLGVNDVWHGEKGTTPGGYEQGLKEMLEIAKQAEAKVVLCTPTIIGEELEGNELNKKLGDYAEIVRRLGRERKATLCDLHAAFLAELDRVNEKNEHQGNLTYDGVHMNDAGNQLIAEKLAEAICRACGGGS